MPLKAIRRFCEAHGRRERFQYACVICGQYGCPESRPRPGQPYGANYQLLCANERSRLYAKYRRHPQPHPSRTGMNAHLTCREEKARYGLTTELSVSE